MEYLKPVNGTLVLVAIASWLFITIYRTYSKPIARLPGPWFTNWTHWAQKYYMLNGLSHQYTYDLHQKYGPIVRISPDEVSISDLHDVKVVYSMRETFRKAKQYQKLRPSKVDSIFNTSNVELHRRYRRMLAGPMSESSLKSAINDVHARVSATVFKMEEEMQTRGAMDVHKWWFFFTTDTIGDLTFGSSFKMIESGKKDQYFDDLQAVNHLGGLRIVFPLLVAIANYIPIPIFEVAKQSSTRIRKYATESIERHKQGLMCGAIKAKETLFSKVIKANEEDALTSEELVVNAQAYIVAGSDTTSNTLTFLTWAVCSKPAIRDRLVAELQTLPDNFTEQDTRDLKYMDQVINETLRVYSAAPTSLLREVPPEGVSLGGYMIEGGTSIGAQAYTMHRNPEVFPNPTEFNPDRWENPTKAMKDAFMPFGRGSRTCIGYHLALIEIRLGVALFFRKFPTAQGSSLEGMSAEDMVPATYFLHTPSGGRCLIEG